MGWKDGSLDIERTCQELRGIVYAMECVGCSAIEGGRRYDNSDIDALLFLDGAAMELIGKLEQARTVTKDGRDQILNE